VTGFDIFTQLKLGTIERLATFYSIATVALVLLACVLMYDQRNFYQATLRFMIRRNRSQGLLRQRTDVLASIMGVIDEEQRRVTCPYQYGVATLGRNVRARVHEFAVDTKRPPMQLTRRRRAVPDPTRQGEPHEDGARHASA